ncbi:class I SAM-dependent methyltransferase [Legionella bononiensis]|uniref:Class I SAM-dependent methyltransferase n=1 Tax=Legionella bononiensis TaxID=2793102 RepID=A0ABS1W7X4_9GAMM|nr:class I SAM-dependent methyltransferase [Legionella bononiensis]MBL7480030.1 class I SAM-dependent methyltransferase [Legionella bononiensis]MBL7525456.1 class I SAM-dependent methyltransferase [Legionella bononiensis]MBL7561639.1 class I SAM-dependent methyltransferase [Legionella bononiensis]
MSSLYFENESYLNYMLEHCHPSNQNDYGRVSGTQFAMKIIQDLEIQDTHKVLEIGCGLGRILNNLRTSYNADFWGCDISSTLIQEAKALFPDYQDQFFVSSAESISAPEKSFDRVIYWGVFEMTDMIKALIETSRILKIGGKALLCSIKNKEFIQDDIDSIKAHQAYIEKNIPIKYLHVENFKKVIDYLGFSISKQYIFDYKDDLIKQKYRNSEDNNYNYSDAIYIIEKLTSTPLDEKSVFSPVEL